MERNLGRPRAIVIGGSVGGLFAAHLLRGIGWDVAVYERVAGDLGDRGTGIGTREELFAVMRHIGLQIDSSTGVQVRGRVGLDRDGAVLHSLPIRAITGAWAGVWEPLRQLLPDDCYIAGTTLTRVEQGSEQVTARFADGTTDDGDLLVAADGLHSIVRTQFIPHIKPQYAGYVAWRGVVEERALSPVFTDLAFQQMIFGFPDGELMLSLPMPGPRGGPYRGQRRCHFVWFRPVPEDALGGLCTDSTGRSHGVTIPPPLIRQELILALKRDADALLAPQLAALVHATERVLLQPIYDLDSPCIAFGRVALLGDAAFVARPHVATGVMKAAIDAQSLTDALNASGGNVLAALAHYDAERQPYGAWLVARGRHVGGYFKSQNIEPRQRIETLMQEYGAAGVIFGQSISARVPT
jgi:2-polyprenyl-6-methoxyphenol hydroxylase-like FAD-dependent oxidoreductase